ncbi:amidohydrolase family protein [Paenibacillus sp. YYML68]|uniref:amidohydrolase family protein n=1 Tax=Paenibacillus sp. YYML68 TaxID=2909250 RepID=UPI0024913C90|nr:amidohydrolase family protein [Paenibacillus sp. YYML68]
MTIHSKRPGVIDTHVHLGVSRFSGVGTTPEAIIQAMDGYGIHTSLVMPQPTLESIPDVHKAIHEMSLQYPGRIYGMASIDPWLSEEAYRAEAAVCMEQYGFVALKLHPLGHNISPLSAGCEKIYETASAYRVPVLVHTGIGNPFSLPSLLIDAAKRYPDVTFVLAHAGFAVYTDEAVVAAKYCDNIILEPSWCPTYTVVKMISAIGAERIIMGSDHLSNLPVELVKYQSIGLSDADLERILVTNPQRIFNI